MGYLARSAACTTCLYAAVAAVTLLAQEPTFRSGVDLVTVDAVVIGGDGRPRKDLQPDDFTLQVDGRARRVLSAQFVAETATASRTALLPTSSHFTSNEDINAGRMVAIAIDRMNIRRVEGRAALRAAATFIDTLDPVDRVGVTGLGQVGPLELTRDHRSLQRRLETFVGQNDPVFLHYNLGMSEALQISDGSRTRLADAVLRECGRSLTEYTSPARTAEANGARADACPEQLEQEARAVAQHARSQARISVSGLEALLASLRDFPGPKTLVLLSEGLIADPRLIDFAPLAAAAHEARVAIYVLQLEVPTFEAAQDRISPTFLQDLQVQGDGLARLAGSARGALFRLVGSDPRPFERILGELSGYYLLAFEPIEGERDGRIHRIHVSLARGGGELRARQAFRLPPERPVQAATDRLVKLLRASRVATELPVRVATYSYAEPDSSNLRVVVSAEADAGASRPRVQLGYVLIDGGGVIVASGTRETESGHYAFSAVVPEGAYSLRVAAIDLLGRAGSVQRPFEARVYEGRGVRVSDLILAQVPERDEVPLEPFVDRVAGSSMMAYVELYASDDVGLQGATVHVAVSAAERTGPALVTVPAKITRRDGKWAVARAVLPIAHLASGRYLARVEVVLQGVSVAQVTRPFRYQAQ